MVSRIGPVSRLDMVFPSKRAGGKGLQHKPGKGGAKDGVKKKNKLSSIKNQMRGVERLLKKVGRGRAGCMHAGLRCTLTPPAGHSSSLQRNLIWSVATTHPPPSLLSTQPDLDPKARAKQEARLAELRASSGAHARSELERKYATRYHKVRFFERVKLERCLRKLQARAAPAGDAAAADALRREVESAAADLAYVLHFPTAEKYVSLLKDSEDPQEQVGGAGGFLGAEEGARAELCCRAAGCSPAACAASLARPQHEVLSRARNRLCAAGAAGVGAAAAAGAGGAADGGGGAGGRGGRGAVPGRAARCRRRRGPRPDQPGGGR